MGSLRSLRLRHVVRVRVFMFDEAGQPCGEAMAPLVAVDEHMAYLYPHLYAAYCVDEEDDYGGGGWFCCMAGGEARLSPEGVALARALRNTTAVWSRRLRWENMKHG